MIDLTIKEIKSEETKLSFGLRIGDLEVIADKSVYHSGKFLQRQCICICGLICYRTERALIEAKRTICNHTCINTDYSNIRTQFVVKFRKIRNDAKVRKIIWKLSNLEALFLIQSNCFYCNSESTVNLPNGIDRLNTDIGYTTLNCVPCCKKCNFGKHIQSLDSFLTHVKMIYENIKLQNLNIPQPV